MIDLSIIIVNWNTKDLLQACLQSVFAHPPAGSFEVWVVDNASTDGSVAMLRQHFPPAQFPQMRLLTNGDNGGFGKGNNQAFERCNGRYIFLLNSDTEVKPLALTRLVQFMDMQPDAGAAGSLLLNPDGTRQESCYPRPTLFRELWRLLHLDRLYMLGRYPMADWEATAPREVDVIQGAALILRREILQKIGLFDETYFMYSEEVDLCRRLQKNGWRLFWLPQSQVVHYGGQSTRQMAEVMFLQLYQSKLIYFRKHDGRLAVWLYKLILALASLVRLALLPLTKLENEAQRQAHFTLGQRYKRLLHDLPSM